jgi:hypothetical protein
MTCTSAARAATKSKTGFEMRVQEPVSTEDHPLGSTGPSTGNSPGSDFSQVAPPSESSLG